LEQTPAPKYSKSCIIGHSLWSMKMKLDKAAKKIASVMHEFKTKSLHSGAGGKVVKNPRQAVAIALSQASKLKKGKK